MPLRTTPSRWQLGPGYSVAGAPGFHALVTPLNRALHVIAITRERLNPQTPAPTLNARKPRARAVSRRCDTSRGTITAFCCGQRQWAIPSRTGDRRPKWNASASDPRRGTPRAPHRSRRLDQTPSRVHHTTHRRNRRGDQRQVPPRVGLNHRQPHPTTSPRSRNHKPSSKADRHNQTTRLLRASHRP